MTYPPLTQERLREVLEYSPETGAFVWRVRSGRSAAGRQAGFAHCNGYWDISVDGKTYRAHRLAWLYMTGEWPAADVDHVNRNRRDNRWANLRSATRTQNNANRKASSAHGFKGATFNKRQGRWAAQSKLHGKPVYLGYYDTPEKAHAAYMAFAEKTFGEFARAA